MVQGLPIQAKYKHNWHLFNSKCSAYNSFKVYYYVFIFHIYSFEEEEEEEEEEEWIFYFSILKLYIWNMKT
jgi:hypothetical protein